MSFSLDLPALIEGATHTLSRSRPFLRWAGSKRGLLSQILPSLPGDIRTYREPFLGSGALFFLLKPQHAVLSDTCADLVQAYVALRDNVDEVIGWFEGRKPDREYYYSLRSNRSEEAVTRAAELIYLNRTCWNGLYRVNSKGQFNVPYGRPKSDVLVDPVHLRACSLALAPAEVFEADFEEAVADAVAGDLVFFDPPYVTGHNNNGFIDYNERLFSWADQQRLARIAGALADRGVSVVVSNAAHQDVIALYPSFRVREISRATTLAGHPRHRGRVSEVIMSRLPPDAGLISETVER